MIRFCMDTQYNIFNFIFGKGEFHMALKPGPKPIAKSTGKPDQRRRDNKNTPGNTPSLKPSKSSR